MKSTKMRVRRALPVIAISMLAIAIGIMTIINVKSILNKASASTTKVEVRIGDEAILPEILSVSPTHGSSLGGTLLTFTGFNLNGITHIIVGGAECKPISYISSEEVTCITAAHMPGEVSIVVTSEAGTIRPDITFTYDTIIIPIPPDTSGESESPSTLVPGLPGTGMFLFGTSIYLTFLEIILISFIIIAILGIVIYYLCPATKRKNTTKSTKKRKTTRSKSKSRK